jgi:hypothetical protein
VSGFMRDVLQVSARAKQRGERQQLTPASVLLLRSRTKPISRASEAAGRAPTTDSNERPPPALARQQLNPTGVLLLRSRAKNISCAPPTAAHPPPTPAYWKTSFCARFARAGRDRRARHPGHREGRLEAATNRPGILPLHPLYPCVARVQDAGLDLEGPPHGGLGHRRIQRPGAAGEAGEERNPRGRGGEEGVPEDPEARYAERGAEGGGEAMHGARVGRREEHQNVDRAPAKQPGSRKDPPGQRLGGRAVSVPPHQGSNAGMPRVA